MILQEIMLYHDINTFQSYKEAKKKFMEEEAKSKTLQANKRRMVIDYLLFLETIQHCKITIFYSLFDYKID